MCTHLPADLSRPRTYWPPDNICQEAAARADGCHCPGRWLCGPHAPGASTLPSVEGAPFRWNAPLQPPVPIAASIRSEERMEVSGVFEQLRSPAADGSVELPAAPACSPRAQTAAESGCRGRGLGREGGGAGVASSPPRAAAGSLHPGHLETWPAKKGGISRQRVGT